MGRVGGGRGGAEGSCSEISSVACDRVMSLQTENLETVRSSATADVTAEFMNEQAG